VYFKYLLKEKWRRERERRRERVCRGGLSFTLLEWC